MSGIRAVALHRAREVPTGCSEHTGGYPVDARCAEGNARSPPSAHGEVPDWWIWRTENCPVGGISGGGWEEGEEAADFFRGEGDGELVEEVAQLAGSQGSVLRGLVGSPDGHGLVGDGDVPA